MDTGDKVALKIIKNEMMEYISMEDIEKEVDILKQLEHKHITRLIESGYTDLVSRGKKNKVFYIALEVASGGELFDFISVTGPFSENVARYFFHQFIDAMEYLHDSGISHRDLKTENILFDKKFNLKVADFGYASKQGTNQTAVGTEDYMAPEVLQQQPYSGKVVDVFGAGLILFMMVSQSKAFLKASPNDSYYKNLVTNRPDKFWKSHCENKGDPDFYTEEFKNLINQLFAYSPCHRLTISEIKEHPWYTGTLPSKEDIKEEFRRRKADLDDEHRSLKEQDPASFEFDPEVFKNKVHRGIGDDEDDEFSEDAKTAEGEREEMEYDDDFKKYTQFFSTSKLDDLWNTLGHYISTVSSDYMYSAFHYRTVARIVPQTEGKFLIVELSKRKFVLRTQNNILFIGDEEAKPIKFMVSILKVEGQDKHCIEADLLEGDPFIYAEEFKKMQRFFAGHANAAESD